MPVFHTAVGVSTPSTSTRVDRSRNNQNGGNELKVTAFHEAFQLLRREVGGFVLLVSASTHNACHAENGEDGRRQKCAGFSSQREAAHDPAGAHHSQEYRQHRLYRDRDVGSQASRKGHGKDDVTQRVKYTSGELEGGKISCRPN